MAQEDKLTADERIRLEALNQSVQCRAFSGTSEPDNNTLKRATVFEDYIKKGKVEDNGSKH